MLFQWLFFIFLIENCAIIENVRCETSSALPDLLVDCYRSNFSIVAKPPLTIPLLVELIRKVELDTNSLNIRVLAASMLHGVVFDGITKSEHDYDEDVSIPYAATGNEFFKYKLIVDYLTPGNSQLFPRNSLSAPEFCFLHKLISNTVESRARGDERETCVWNTNMPYELYGNENGVSDCPIKRGVIKTIWGPITIGHIIKGIASRLEPEIVTFHRVVGAIKENKNITTVPRKFVSHSSNVNTVWVSTIAGDLAEVVLNQGTAQPIIGNSGSWNDTILPRVYYLKSPIWDMTEAEILAGIDATIIASNIKKWLEVLDTTRLSQIIDMYYSDRGIIYDKRFKADNRSITLQHLLNEIDLEQQISGAVKLLQEVGAPSENTFSNDDILQLTTLVTERFKSAAENLTKQYDNVEYINGKPMMSPIELIIIFDGGYDSYTAQQLLCAITEAIQVSYYGSKIGIINGQSANWIANVTAELFELFTNLQNAEGKWPATLSLSDSLETVIEYYQNKTRDCSVKQMKPLGQSIVIFSHDGRLTDADKTKTRQAVNSIKGLYPETNIFYVTSDENNSFKELTNNEFDNDLVIKPTNDVLSLANQLADNLRKVPANIVKLYCNHSQVRFEDYITPDIETHYQIHRNYLKKTAITTKFSNSDYGELVICGKTSQSSPDNKLCKDLTVNGEVSFKSEDFCSSESTCDIHYIVTANTSKIKCAENDCRYPDQIRLAITYSKGNVILMSKLVLIFYLYCIFYLI